MLVHSDAELYALLIFDVIRPSFCPSRNCQKYPNRLPTQAFQGLPLTYRCSHVFRRYFYHVGSDVLRPFLACFLTLATFYVFDCRGIKIEQIHNISALECSLFGISSELTFTK